MAEQVVVEEKSDGLDIVSIGKLYQGSWEKKYWSSSRGKDRHPYPVGYVAVRTYNGNSYKMAILEGLQGPEFMISSTDGQSCSGQTPDIAWEGFQKKSCIRMKFWQGKRYSCKIGGAELFGFKNPLVRRLLRGLKANVSEATEQSLPSSCLVKTQGKEKRSKKRKEIYVKLVSGAEHKRGRPQDLTQSGDGPQSRQSCEGNHNKGIPSTSSTSIENNTDLETVACGGNNSFRLLPAEDGLQVDYSISCEHIEKDKYLAAQEASSSISSKDFISNEEGIDLLKGKENLDGSMFTSTPEFSSSKTVDGKGDIPVQKVSQMLDDVELYAPDTLDLALDSTCNPEVEISKESTSTMSDRLNATQILVSEKCVTESYSKDEMVIASGSDNSEKSDSDPVGQEIAKSMMTLLLPRALPLLKTYSRKKNTSPNCGKKDCHGMSQEERKGTNQSLEDEPPAKSSSEQIQLEKLNGEVHVPDKLFTENLKFEKQNENVLLPSTYTYSLVPGLEDSTAIAPDSFENDQCELVERSQVGQFQDAVKADQNTFGMDLCTHEGHHVYPNIQPSEEVCHIGKTTGDTKSNQDVDWVLEKRPQRGGKTMTSYVSGNTSPSRKDPSTCSDTPFVENYPGQTDVKISPSQSKGTATTFDAKSTSSVGIHHVAQKRVRCVTGGVGAGNVSFMPIPNISNSTSCYDNHSESISCRDCGGDLVMETCSAANQSASDSHSDKMRPDEQICSLQMKRNPRGSDGTSCVMATIAPHQDYALSPNYKFTLDGVSRIGGGQPQASGYTDLFEIQSHYEVDGSISVSHYQRVSHHDMTEKEEAKNESCFNKLTEMVHKDELENIFELVGCYVHPMPISMVTLRTKGDEIFICVLCGYLMERNRTLFIYKTSIRGERRGCPSFTGHATIVSPISRNTFGGQMLDSSSLQFTPDGKCLVLLNEIKAPYCREGSVDCECSVCTSDCLEKNAVKVVQVKLGYVEVLCKLETTNKVSCILVCEPGYLVAAEESGRMNLWTMNSTWSDPTEQSYLPTSDCMPNYIVEMKRVPNFPALIVGHSAFGDFCLWDLMRRVLVSKFSAPRTSFLPFLPINLFRCPSQAFSATGACRKKQAVDIMGETRMWSSETGNHASVKEEDLSLVLLVSSVLNLDPQNNYPCKDSGVSSVGRWSLALLAKSKLISETALDPSASIVGASAGYGIIARCDGSLYIWELSTGTKLGHLSHCRGSTVSCLAADDSGSGVFAVAVDGSQVLLYAPGISATKKHE